MPNDKAGEGLPTVEGPPIDEIEFDLLIDGLYRRYGYDFRHYAHASLKRRVLDMVERENLENIGRLLVLALRESQVARRLVHHLTVNYTDMFRDPEVFALLRKRIMPILATYPFFRIWHVGVATGEEAYALAIVLAEMNLYERSRIYATDINDDVLLKAHEGIYPAGMMQQYTRNYLAAGGKEEFSMYYTTRFENAAFSDRLKKNITFAKHNLVTDASFNVFNLILCRNVTIYFDDVLTRNVHEILYNSLAVQGVLVLGSRENLRFSPYANRYEAIDESLSVYRKVA